MMCFRDKTFCCSEQHEPECDRAWTGELQAAADRWWGKPGAPVCFAPLCDAAREMVPAPEREGAGVGR
jgi:hypothetical protein